MTENWSTYPAFAALLFLVIQVLGLAGGMPGKEGEKKSLNRRIHNVFLSIFEHKYLYKPLPLVTKVATWVILPRVLDTLLLLLKYKKTNLIHSSTNYFIS